MKLLLALSFLASVAAHADIGNDFDSLGGNKIILEKAKALNPEINTSIVQDRTVSRRNRWELTTEVAGSFGGDTYVETLNAAINVHYHINPRWSLGLRYAKDFNKLTAEGTALIDQAQREYAEDPENPRALIPNIDYPKEEQMALINWYPIYGKMNLLDKGVAQFDVYALVGAGKVQLNSSNQSTYTAGGGFGIWWNQKFSTRLEMRYQNYKAQYFQGEQNMHVAIASMQMGWLL